MTSKEDDTLPLPVLSQELSGDVTVDEDFIPTSQPQGIECSKLSKNSVESNKSPKLFECTGGVIDDTLPCEIYVSKAELDKDKSADFIPDTETKKIKTAHAHQEISCKKKLEVFTDNGNTCQLQSNPLWETQKPHGPETPFSIIDSSPAEGLQRRPTNDVSNFDKSITEIIVNDSAETVDLESSPARGVKSENTKSLSVTCSVDSDVERCEETQIFDNSSLVLLEPPISSAMLDQSERSVKDETSQNLYFARTVDDSESDLQELANPVVSESTPSFAVDTKRALQENQVVSCTHPEDDSGLKGKVEADGKLEEENCSLIATRRIDFKLTVTCFVTFQTKTNKVLQKFISKVNGSHKSQATPFEGNRFSDLTSEKSKRYSTSSSGSVYSDKLGLPFPLPKRVSAVSDQTDSSEDDFGVLLKQKSKALGRVPWSNEYLMPLKLDELVQFSLEDELAVERSTGATALKKPKGKRSAEAIRPKKPTNVKSSSKSSEDDAEQKTVDTEFSAVEERVEDVGEESVAERENERIESGAAAVVEGVEDARSTQVAQVAQGEVFGAEEREQRKEGTSVVLQEGVSVLARWSDKRYYPGVLCGSQKSDRWDVRFDDGTSKTVREDFIMPSGWLTEGALVFILVDERYESGQITRVEERKEQITYSVELDVEKKKITCTLSELCLTDVMASIVREKYKPPSGTPRGKADIDFENVLSGKRLREQRTPLRPPTGVGTGSSGPKKKSSTKLKGDEGRGLETIRETPEPEGTGKIAATLRSSGGHLVEDKVVSADSPSGNEVTATPLRTSAGRSRTKPTPRALSYDPDPDPSPVPGPSGLKPGRRRDRREEKEAEDAGGPPVKKSASRGKRKRKIDAPPEDDSVKKPRKKDAQLKAKSKRR